MKVVSRHALLAFFLLSLFVFSVHLRRATFDRYPAPGDGLWRNLHTDALTAVRNWYSVGAWESGLAPNFTEPASGFVPRLPYLSYPTLFVALPWAVARITNQFPSLRLLMILSLATSLVLAWVLAEFLLLLLPRFGWSEWEATWFAGVGGALALLLPSSLLFFQNTWWADVVVLPLCAALLWLEAKRDCSGREAYAFAWWAVVVLGLWADWYFYCLLAALAFWRWRQKESWRAPALAILLGLSAHLALVSAHGFWPRFLAKLAQRSNWAVDPKFDWRNWWDFVQSLLGAGGAALYALGWLAVLPLAYLAGKKIPGRPAQATLWKYTFLLLAPIYLHFLLVSQHYFQHPYEALKLSLPLACLPAVLLPAYFFPGRRWALGVVTAVVAIYLSFAPVRYRGHASGAVNLNAAVEARCAALLPELAATDVVVSPDFATTTPFEQYSPDDLWRVVPWANRPCYHQLFLVQRPHELAAAAWRLRWDLAQVRLRAIFLQEPSAEWKLVARTEPKKIADFWLLDLDRERMPR